MQHTIDQLHERAKRAESALATERAVSANLVRQIQAVRDLKSYRMGLGPYGQEYLDRQQVLKLLSPQNDASG